MITLSCRFKRLCAKTEITSVGISPSGDFAFAIFSAPQTTQSWIDIFDVDTLRGRTKIAGSHAVFPSFSALSESATSVSSSSSRSSRTSDGGGSSSSAVKLVSAFADKLNRASDKVASEHSNRRRRSGSRNDRTITENGNSNNNIRGADRLIGTLRDSNMSTPGPAQDRAQTSSILIRDIFTGKTVQEIPGATRDPVVWSRDGLALAAGEPSSSSSQNFRLGVWDARTGQLTGRVVAHIDRVTHAAFGPGPGRTLVTLSRDGSVRVTHTASGRTLRRLEIEGATAANNPRLLAVSNDGRRITSLWATTVHVWTPEAGQVSSYDLRTTRRTEGWPVCLSEDGRWMVCRTEDGFDVTETASGTVVWVSSGSDGAEGIESLITAACFGRDGRVLLIGRMNGAVELWDVAEGVEGSGFNK